MKRLIFILVFTSLLLIFSCKKDDDRSCTTCSSAETLNFQVCEESNGKASVNGEDTGTPYDVYIAGLEEAGANCGG